MESVWDYPRPPRVEPCARRVRIECGRRVVADSRRALRVLETSHPPTIYIPREDFAEGIVEPGRGATMCEFKGRASYVDVCGRRNAGWFYPEPVAAFEALRGTVAVYPSRMDACYLGDELVMAQDGDFYGGWVTAELTGPFKGGAGTLGW